MSQLCLSIGAQYRVFLCWRHPLCLLLFCSLTLQVKKAICMLHESWWWKIAKRVSKEVPVATGRSCGKSSNYAHFVCACSCYNYYNHEGDTQHTMYLNRSFEEVFLYKCTCLLINSSITLKHIDMLDTTVIKLKHATMHKTYYNKCQSYLIICSFSYWSHELNLAHSTSFSTALVNSSSLVRLYLSSWLKTGFCNMVLSII